MKIIQLRSQNVKRLSAVEITPTGDLVVIGGKNGAGKSSVLDSIMFALAGGDKLPKMPVRRGADKAKIVLNLGELVVTRTFTAGGGTSLTIKGKEGVKFGSPQTMLDNLTGRLSFDPLEFAREKPSKQAETLRALVGLDVSKLEAEHAQLFAQRTEANRRVKQTEAHLAQLPAPAEGQARTPGSVSAILDKINKAMDGNARNTARRDERNRIQSAIDQCCTEIEDKNRQIAELQKKLKAWEQEKLGWDKKLEGIPAASIPDDQDVTPLRAQADKVEDENKLVDAAVAFDRVKADLAGHQKEADALDLAISANRTAKNSAIRTAKYPIEGLALDDAGAVVMNGIPFEQCSSAEQLRVSVAIGLALNPKLKVLLIRDGSLLDDDSLALVAKMAAEAKAQVWIERVEEGDNVSVVIEDGHVKGVEPKEIEPEPDPKHALDGKECPDCSRPTAISKEKAMRYCTGKCGWWEDYPRKLPALGATEPPPDETKAGSDATEPGKPATDKGCPRCGAPMAFGPSGLECTAKCKPVATQRPAHFTLTEEAPEE